MPSYSGFILVSDNDQTFAEDKNMIPIKQLT